MTEQSFKNMRKRTITTAVVEMKKLKCPHFGLFAAFIMNAQMQQIACEI